ncbi:MAG: GntR family transcriptional regulator [Sphingobium sp.]|jgi:DNA-binding FadR family transcriptional regulator|nr:GntR family transcriptional regulator [Sphingobium sp.]
MSSPPKAARLYQTVAERIARAIASGVYAPGDRLPAERELAASFDVSRPTVREAIIALEIDGLVEVRIGSGVYVINAAPKAAGVVMDIGAFELIEARLLIEGEAAALAATQITDEELTELDALLDEMARANMKSAGSGELVDRRFHELIAAITRNSAMLASVEQLWTIRNRSPQCIRLFEKTRAKGYVPVIDEHRDIVDALRTRDPNVARTAMRAHLSRVLEYFLDATEVEAIEAAKAEMAAKRSRFGRTAAS